MQMLPMNNGLFSHIDYDFPEVLTITNQELDLTFLTMYGLKVCAPVLHVVHQDESSPFLTSSELTTLASLILSMYKWKWDKLSSILSLNYDPIHNYYDSFTESLSEAIDKSDTLTHNTTVTDNSSLTIDKSVRDGGSEQHSTTSTSTKSSTDGGSETVTKSGSSSDTIRDGGSESRSTTTSSTSTRTDDLSEEVTSDVENNVFGFNSDEAVGDNTSATHRISANTGTQENQSSGSESVTITGGLTKSTSGTNSEETVTEGGLTNSTSGQSSEQLTITGGLTHTTDDDRVTQGTKRTTGTEGNESSSDRTRTRESTHLGNIGNLTTQQLVNQEIELWRWTLIQQVLNDVKDFLTLPLYD